MSDTLTELRALILSSSAAQAQQLLTAYLAQQPPLEACLQLAKALGRCETARWLLVSALPERHPQDAVTIARALIALAYLREALALLNSAGGADAALQRALAHYWLNDYRQALSGAQHSYAQAKAARELASAIAAYTLTGEVLLAQGNAKAAAISFGRALGLCEYRSEAHLTVWPLAGLGQAQWAWGYPAKAQRTLDKALARAAGDPLGESRALQALGLLRGEADAFAAAATKAQGLHLPLWLASHRYAASCGITLAGTVQAQALAAELGIPFTLEQDRGAK